MTATVGVMVIELVGHVRAVCVGSVAALTLGRRIVETAFVKTPVEGSLRLGELGFPGDEKFPKTFFTQLFSGFGKSK